MTRRHLPLILAITALGCRTPRQEPPAFVNNPRQIQEHILSPPPPLRLSQTEWNQLRASPCPYEGVIPYELLLSSAGLVESAHPLHYQSDCNSTPPPVLSAHLAEAETLIRTTRFNPWILNGQPASVLVQTTLAVAPPERYGPPQPFPSSPDLSKLAITMQRLGCDGRCPAYSVTIAGNGTIAYIGYSYTAIPGHHTAHIAQPEVDRLLELFRQARFLSALPAYQGAVGAGLTTLRLSIDGNTHQMNDEDGMSAGLPTAVKSLEQAIDQAAGTHRWIVGDPTTIPSLDAEHWNFASGEEDNLRLYDRSIRARNSVLLERFLKAQAPVLPDFTSTEPRWWDSDPPPIVAAAGSGDVALVERMLHPLPSPVPLAIRFHCLLAAAGSGSIPMFNLWLAQGIDPHMSPVTLAGRPTQRNDGNDLLRRAIQSGQPEMVRRVRELCFDPKQPPPPRPSPNTFISNPPTEPSHRRPAPPQNLVKPPTPPKKP